jgi:ubiquinone/menaquinone biosynthesis C-methylase UbiE
VPNSSLKSFWNDYSPYYSMLGISPVFQQFLGDTVERANISPGQQVLDLGCGPGYFLPPLVKSGARVTAVDYSEAMLARAKRALPENRSSEPQSNVTFVFADAPEYLQSVADATFDIVIASLFLSYLPRPEALLGRIFQILKPGGRLVMSNPVPKPHFGRIFWKSGWTSIRHLFAAIQLLRYAGQIKRWEKAGVFHFFDYNETQEMLVRAGFEPRSLTITSTLAGTVFLTTAIKPAN